MKISSARSSPFVRRLLLLAGLATVTTAPAETSVPLAVPAAPRTITVEGKTVPVIGFDRLSGFPFTIVDLGTGATREQIEVARKRDQVPAAVRAYDGKRVAVIGYLMPLQLENGLAKKLVLMRDVMTCCYGATPNMNDYAMVTMKGEGIKVVQDIPITLVGVLHVEPKYEDGYLTSLYQVDGEVFLGAGK